MIIIRVHTLEVVRMSSTPRSVWVSVSCVRSCGRESCLEYTGVFRIFDLLLLLLLLLLRPVVSPVSQYFFQTSSPSVQRTSSEFVIFRFTSHSSRHPVVSQ